MHALDDFLLALYRGAREQPPARFQEVLLDRLQKRFDFSAAFWCDARVADATTLVPTALHLRNVDPSFLIDWTELHPLDPAVPMALSIPAPPFASMCRASMPGHRTSPSCCAGTRSSR